MATTIITKYEALGLQYHWSNPITWGVNARGRTAKIWTNNPGVNNDDSRRNKTRPTSTLVLYMGKEGGELFSAIDVDKNKETGDFTEQGRAMMNALRNHNFVARTGSGGFHYIFKYSNFKDREDFSSGTCPTSCIDIRNDGGILFAEPTHYTADGDERRYVWERIPDSYDEIGDFPGDAIELLWLHCPAYGIQARRAVEEHATATAVEALRPENQEVKRLCDCLSAEWLSDFNNWMKFMFAMKSISADDDEILQIFLDTCARAPGYEGQMARIHNETQWSRHRERGANKIGIGSLRYWAKQQNPNEYFRMNKPSYMAMIESALHTDFARIFEKEVGNNVMYQPMSDAKGIFYVFNEDTCLWENRLTQRINFYYVEVMEQVCRRLIGELPVATTDEEREERKKKMDIITKAIRTINSTALTVIKEYLPAICDVGEKEPHELMNASPHLLPLNNGVFDFKKRELVPYEREHYFTFKLPTNYNATADTSKITKLMKMWFNSDEVVEFVRYFLGYCLTGDRSRQEFLVVWGESASNGKSTLFEEIFSSLLGVGSRGFSHKLNIKDMMKMGKGGATSANQDSIYNLENKRFALLNEPNGVRIDDELIKQLTGDLAVSVMAKFKGEKTFSPIAKMLILCNKLVKTNLAEKGLNRRQLVLEQNNTFLTQDKFNAIPASKKANYITQEDWKALPEAEREGKQVYFILNAERQALLAEVMADKDALMAYFVGGALEFMANKTKAVPKEMRESKSKAEQHLDTLKHWINGNIEADAEGGHITLSALKQEWRRNGLFFGQNEHGFNTAFCDKCEELGFETFRGTPGKSKEKIMNARLVVEE